MRSIAHGVYGAQPSSWGRATGEAGFVAVISPRQLQNDEVKLA